MTKFLLPFFLLLVGACKPGDGDDQGSVSLNGPQKFYYPDGSLYLEGTYKDSVAVGLFKQYFKNGKVYEEANYVDGVLHGEVKRYHENGQLAFVIPYDSGRVHGIKRKFRTDGTLAYEAPFHYNNPCVGLKEYYTSGRQVIRWPQIVITEEDRTWKDNRFSLKISMSEKGKVEFFQGSLNNEKYIGDKAEKIYMERDGTARLDYFIPPGGVVLETVNIIAKFQTALGNSYITQRRYNIGSENRGY